MWLLVISLSYILAIILRARRFFFGSVQNKKIGRYCSNYYSESSEPIEVCDWCKSEERIPRHGGSSARKSSAGNDGGITNRSEYSSSGERIKQHDREEGSERGKNNPSGGTPSPRPSTRRYKLLKDVMCWSSEEERIKSKEEGKMVPKGPFPLISCQHHLS